MGYIYEFNCDSCNIKEEFRLGHGMRDFDASVVVDRFADESVKKAIREAQEKRELWTFNWKLAQCEACGKLLRVPTVSVFGDDIVEYMDGSCECGMHTDKVIDVESRDIADIPCRTCSGKLTYKKVGFWD